MINDVPIECINIVSMQYCVPAPIIISVLKAEGGRVGHANLNKNGTVDYEPMQVNSIWLDRLKKYGYSKNDLQNNPCLNVAAGTWILAQAIAEEKSSIWKGIGNYHSHTYDKNLSYQYKVGFYTRLLEKALSTK